MGNRLSNRVKRIGVVDVFVKYFTYFFALSFGR